MTYTADMLIRIAKRRNNTKRRYLVVNPLQGKHLPVHPQDALRMMSALGGMVKEAHPYEKVLCIGFAETATAIGAAVAGCFNGNYIHTTREDAGRAYFSFSEEHSHAAEQKLCRDNWERLCKGVERLVLVEDEVSTGKTLRALVSLLKKSGAVPKAMRFSAASLINLMSGEDLRLFAEEDIEPLFLVKACNVDFDARADRLAAVPPGTFSQREPLWVIPVSGKKDPRTGVSTAEYQAACAALGDRLLRLVQEKLIAQGKLPVQGRLLVLGAEECMYPALSVAAAFERAYPNLSVYNHATTRTPIAPSPPYAPPASNTAPPVTKGYLLRSVYAPSRPVYLYNVDAYDAALLITDSSLSNDDLQAPLNDVRSALTHAGTRSFLAVHWV